MRDITSNSLSPYGYLYARGLEGGFPIMLVGIIIYSSGLRQDRPGCYTAATSHHRRTSGKIGLQRSCIKLSQDSVRAERVCYVAAEGHLWMTSVQTRAVTNITGWRQAEQGCYAAAANHFRITLTLEHNGAVTQLQEVITNMMSEQKATVMQLL